MKKKSVKKNNKIENKIVISDKIRKLIKLIGNCVGLAMGVSVIVLTILKKLETNNAIYMIAIGLFCVSIPAIMKRD